MITPLKRHGHNHIINLLVVVSNQILTFSPLWQGCSELSLILAGLKKKCRNQSSRQIQSYHSNDTITLSENKMPKRGYRTRTLAYDVAPCCLKGDNGWSTRTIPYKQIKPLCKAAQKIKKKQEKPLCTCLRGCVLNVCPTKSPNHFTLNKTIKYIQNSKDRESKQKQEK